MNKKKFFKSKIERVQYETWEIEFKVAKSRQVREGVRQDRDRAIETVRILSERMKNEKNKETKKKLQSEHDTFFENISRYEKQMEMLDNQINGYAGDDIHEPVIGLIEQLASLAELKTMYTDYVKKV